MPSSALARWRGVRSDELDELLTAHSMLGGRGVARRYSTQQVCFAYLAAVAAQFQGFCRDLHSEAVGVVAKACPPDIGTIVHWTLSRHRKLDQGNANSGNIAEDFLRIGMERFWEQVALHGGRHHTEVRRSRLEQMNTWRNAIAHNNFEQYQSKVALLGGRLRPRLVEGTRCRAACGLLARQMDEAVGAFLGRIVGAVPW